MLNDKHPFTKRQTPLPSYNKSPSSLSSTHTHSVFPKKYHYITMVASSSSKAFYDPRTKTYHSLRPKHPLPDPSLPLSVASYTFSLLKSSGVDFSTQTFITNANSGNSLTYSQFLSQTRSLSHSLQKQYKLSPNDVAFVLSPPNIHIPIIYFSLLSLNVTVSPANPLGSLSEISHQVRVSNPKLAFATSSTARALRSLPNPPEIILIDSPEFASLLNHHYDDDVTVHVRQSDTACILFSSGTTGMVKGVALTHRNFIALISGMYHNKADAVPDEKPVSLFTLPLFHVFGFFMMVRVVAFGERMVLMEKFEFEGMLRAVEKYGVTYMPVSPPLIVAFVKSELTRKYDLSSLMAVGCGGAPLGKEVAERFREKFPHVEIFQGYGLTETGGGATRTIDPEETRRYGSPGRLAENFEAKIVDPETGEALPPGKRGELWLRSATIMKGYVGNDKATAETLDPDGWLKTGDLCYFDSEGFLYIVDRLKELIKYKAYQVPPAELEKLLQSHPSIADAAVIPYPDEEAGQIPMAYVVRKPESNINEAQVIEFIAKQVAPYKKVRRVAFVSAIPKSPAGKILRRELITHAVSGGSSKL